MKLRTLFFLTAFALLFSAEGAHAQNCIIVTPYYNTYLTQSTDGTHLTTSILVDGYASMYENPVCQQRQ